MQTVCAHTRAVGGSEHTCAPVCHRLAVWLRWIWWMCSECMELRNSWDKYWLHSRKTNWSEGLYNIIHAQISGCLLRTCNFIVSSLVIHPVYFFFMCMHNSENKLALSSYCCIPSSCAHVWLWLWKSWSGSQDKYMYILCMMCVGKIVSLKGSTAPL